MKIPAFLVWVALMFQAAPSLSGQSGPDYVFDQNVYVRLETGSHHCPVSDIAFAPGGSVISVSADKTIRFWNPSDGSMEKCLRGWIGLGMEGSWFSVAAHPDGIHVAAAGWYQGRDLVDWNSGTIRVFSSRFKEEEDLWDKLHMLKQSLVGHSTQIRCLRYSPDGSVLASGDVRGGLRLWDGAGNDLFRFTTTPDRGITDMDFSPDGTWLAVTAEDGSLYLYDVRTGALQASCKPSGGNPAKSVMFSPDNRKVLAGTLDGKVILRNIPQLSLSSLVADTGSAVPVLARFRSATRIAYTGPLASGASGSQAWPVLETGIEGGPSVEIARFDREIRTLAVSRETGTLGIHARGGYSFTLIDAAGKITICGKEGTAIKKLAWMDGGEGLIINGGEWRFRLDKRQLVRGEAAWPDDLEQVLPPGITSTVENGSTMFRYLGRPIYLTLFKTPQTAALSPDGRWIAVSATNGDIFLLDAENLDVHRIFAGSEGLVNALAFSPDSRLLASGGSDQIIRLWDCSGETGLEPRAFVEMDQIKAFHDLLSRLEGYYPDMDIHSSRGILDLYDEMKMTAPQNNFAFLLSPPRQQALLGLHAEADGEWALWTPFGYYDCSLEGARLVGWHSNQESWNFLNHNSRFLGPWFPLEQFSALYYRPDIIEKALGNKLTPREPILTMGYSPPDLFFFKLNGKEYEENNIEIRTDQAEFSMFFLANCTGSRLRQPELFYNGRVISQGKFKGPPEVKINDEGSSLEASYTFSLTSRDNWYRVYTPDEKGCTSASRLVHVIYTGKDASPSFYRLGEKVAKPRSGGTLFVLAIGVNQYTNPGMAQAGMGNLAYAEKDAADMAGLWQTQQGRLFDKVETTVLTNEKLGHPVTRSDILGAFTVLGKKATRDTDSVLVFLSGHGLRKDDGYYFLSSEADPSSKQALDQTSPSWLSIGDKLKSFTRVREIVVLVDACHSGAINPTELGFTWKDKGVVLITSSRAGQKSYEGGSFIGPDRQKSVFANGLFTRAIMDGFGLAGQAAGAPGQVLEPAMLPGGFAPADTSQDNVLIVGEVLSHAIREVGEWTNGQQTPWVPAYDPAIEGKVLGVVQ